MLFSWRSQIGIILIQNGAAWSLKSRENGVIAKVIYFIAGWIVRDIAQRIFPASTLPPHRGSQWTTCFTTSNAGVCVPAQALSCTECHPPVARPAFSMPVSRGTRPRLVLCRIAPTRGLGTSARTNRRRFELSYFRCLALPYAMGRCFELRKSIDDLTPPISVPRK